MILAHEINKYATLDRHSIVKALARSGYTGVSFQEVEFLGVTRTGDFCYRATYHDEAGTGEEEVCNIYVNKNATGDMVAEF